MIPFAGDVLWSNSIHAPIFSIILSLLLLLVSHLCLLDTSFRGAIFRLALCFPTLFFIIDILCNPQYSLGSFVRDTSWGVLSWHLVAKAIDVGVVYTLQGNSAPRWCVPDWAKEIKEKQNGGHHVGHLDGIQSKKTDEKALHVWQRSILETRPEWAVETNHLPQYWKLLALPDHPMDCLLWAIDVITLRRHGTSFLFPNEMRALEWSQSRLQVAGKAHQKYSVIQLKKNKDPKVIPLGYSETPYVDAIVQMIIFIWAIDYISRLDISASDGFYTLSFAKQYAITFCLGALIAFPGDLPEVLLFPVLQRWPFNVPCTTITPTYRNVARSKTVSDLWGYRWHAISRRDFVRLGFLFPIGSKIRALTVLKTFFSSAVLHSFMFARANRSEQATSKIGNILYNPGSYGLFLGQGCLVILENVIAPFLIQSRFYKRCKASSILFKLLSTLQSIYVYGSLIWMARWFVAELVSFNMFTQEMIQTLSLKSLWNDVRASEWYRGSLSRHK